MKRLTSILAWGVMAVFSGLVWLAASYAQDEVLPSSGIVPQHISMGVGKSVIVTLPQEASEIFVANPKVANAVVRSPRKLYLIGIEAGQTSVFALDHEGRKIAAFELSIGRDIGELQQILRAAMPSTQIVARTVNDTIILIGTVDSPEEAQRAFDIAKGFVQRILAGGAGGPAGSTLEGRVVNSLIIRGRDQVMLKVTVAEISRDVAKQLGITTSSLITGWGKFTQFNPFAIKGVIDATAAAQPGYPANAAFTALTAHNADNSLNATLQAFEQYGVSRILAEPTVSAVSGENAKLTVGGEIPIPSVPTCGITGVGQAGGSQTSSCTGGTTYQPYGVTLRFSPVVLAEGRILLHLATEVTELDRKNGANIFGAFVPGLLTRKNETTVEIPSGGSIATAGLLQTTSQQAINGLPGLLDLPVLGALFRSRDYQRNETELMIVVTPYIIKPTQPNEIAKPTDGFADASDPQSWLLGRLNRLYATPGNQEAIQDYKGPVGFIQD